MSNGVPTTALSSSRGNQAFPSLGETKGSWKLGRILRDEPEAYRQMLTYVEMGAFPWVCAQAMGVHYATWNKWMNRGRIASKGMYRTLYLDVMKARAQARLVAELDVRRQEPKTYLRSGPGAFKDENAHGANLPGWVDDEHIGEAPIGIEGESYKTGGSDTYLEVDAETLSATIHEMAKLGFINLTDHGRQLLGESHIPDPPIAEGDIVDASSTPEKDTIPGQPEHPSTIPMAPASKPS